MITRRTLLKLAALLAAPWGLLGAGGAGAAASAVPDLSTEALADKLLGALHEPRSAAVLGRAALSCGLCQSGPAALERTVGSLLVTLGLDARTLAAADQTQIRACLQQACRSDFAAGRTALLEGWVLSYTELRVAAIAQARLQAAA